MVNRTMAQKELKRKRRGRYARFSGETAKFAVRLEQMVVMGEDTTVVKTIEVLVGKISLSKQVINTGRGPDAERMAQYYASVSPESFAVPIPEKTYVLQEYEHLLADTPRENRLRLETDDQAGHLDLFWIGSTYFFVETDLIQNVIRRSRDYGSRKVAFERLKAHRINWSSVLPIG